MLATSELFSNKCKEFVIYLNLCTNNNTNVLLWFVGLWNSWISVAVLKDFIKMGKCLWDFGFN